MYCFDENLVLLDLLIENMKSGEWENEEFKLIDKDYKRTIIVYKTRYKEFGFLIKLNQECTYIIKEYFNYKGYKHEVLISLEAHLEEINEESNSIDYITHKAAQFYNII